MSLSVLWGGRELGVLERVGERTREYTFRYIAAERAISLSLPLRDEPFSPTDSRPFFEALLPEGVVREQIADELKLAASDSYGLLAALGRDCAGALQIVEARRMSEAPSVDWLGDDELDALIAELPRRPLGMTRSDGRVRLSLAGVQRKAVLIRDRDGRFGQPLNGMPSTHILKPDLAGSEYDGLATNEFFCMSLAARCGLRVAEVELLTAAGRPCLSVERFDRDQGAWPPTRTHQEDLCQALGLTPDFKYQKPGWVVPSFQALAGVLDEHGLQPGADRLEGAQAAIFSFLVGNADAHAKNISLLHEDGGVRLAPMYDIVSTAAYPRLSPELALAIGEQLDPEQVGLADWSDFAHDWGLGLTPFQRVRTRLADRTRAEAAALLEEARDEGWHEPVLDRVVATIDARAAQLL